MARVWLKASFVCHSFHYRMPDTVAISSVNPALPSPLTVQMAMLASYLREGFTEKAQSLLDLMPLEVRVRPPKGAIIYRGIMRYVRPPKDAGDVDKNTGAGYKISPHFREFALLDGALEVYVQTLVEHQELVMESLEHIPYLGAKDSLVSCLSVEPYPTDPPEDCAESVEKADLSKNADFLVLQLAEFATKEQLYPPTKGKKSNAISLERLIPSQRDKNHYALGAYVVKGEISSSGNVKLFKRKKS